MNTTTSFDTINFLRENPITLQLVLASAKDEDLKKLLVWFLSMTCKHLYHFTKSYHTVNKIYPVGKEGWTRIFVHQNCPRLIEKTQRSIILSGEVAANTPAHESCLDALVALAELNPRRPILHKSLLAVCAQRGEYDKLVKYHAMKAIDFDMAFRAGLGGNLHCVEFVLDIYKAANLETRKKHATGACLGALITNNIPLVHYLAQREFDQELLLNIMLNNMLHDNIKKLVIRVKMNHESFRTSLSGQVVDEKLETISNIHKAIKAKVIPDAVWRWALNVNDMEVLPLMAKEPPTQTFFADMSDYCFREFVQKILERDEDDIFKVNLEHMKKVNAHALAEEIIAFGRVQYLEMLIESGYKIHGPVKVSSYEMAMYFTRRNIQIEIDIPEVMHKGNATMLEYALDTNPEYIKQCDIDNAIRGGHYECMAIAHERGCPWTKKSTAWAAWTGNLFCMRYAHEHGARWSKRTCSDAAGRGHLECLKYAHEHGAPWNGEVYEKALNSGHVACFEYAAQHGCPIGTKRMYANISDPDGDETEQPPRKRMRTF